MLHVFLGEDDFSIGQAIEQLKKLIESPELVDANINSFNASDISPEQVISVSNTMPFMASRRLVIVYGLLSLNERTQSPSTSKANSKKDNKLREWTALADEISNLPDTTELIFVDYKYRKDNPLLKVLSRKTSIREFRALNKADLHKWINDRCREKSLQISNHSINLLADMAGSNLRLLDNEIEKLSLYAQGEYIGEKEVNLLVSQGREMGIFEAVDSIFEGRFNDALKILKNLHKDTTGPRIITMLSRQIRFILVAKDLQSRNVHEEDIAKSLGINSTFVLGKIRNQSRKYSYDSLKYVHQDLLKIDLHIKSGKIKEESVPGILINVFSEALGNIVNR